MPSSAIAPCDLGRTIVRRGMSFGESLTTTRDESNAGRAGIVILTLMCLLIGIISAYDAYLLVKFQVSIVEQNPLGYWLMELDHGSVALFVGCKFAGTLIVLTTIAFLYLYNKSMGLVVASCLGFGQIVLVFYLTFA